MMITLGNMPVQKVIHGYKIKQFSPIPKNTSSQPFQVRFEAQLPACLLLEDYNPDSKEPFSLIVQSGEIIAEVKFKQIVLPQSDSMNVAVEDTTGDFTRSAFIISMYPKSVSGFKEDVYNDAGVNTGYLADLTIDCLNKLVEAYTVAWKREALFAPKELARRYSKDWFPVIDRASISPIFDIEIFSFNDDLLTQQRHIDFRGTGCSLGMRLQESQLNFLQKACLGDLVKTSDYYEKLANRYFSNSEYEAFLLMVATYIDKYIFEQTRYYLKLQNMTNEEIEDAMHKKTKSRRGRMSITREDALKLILGSKDFKNNISWQDFEENIILLRDEVIHGGITVITRDIATQALRTCNDFLIFLNSKIEGAMVSS